MVLDVAGGVFGHRTSCFRQSRGWLPLLSMPLPAPPIQGDANCAISAATSPAKNPQAAGLQHREGDDQERHHEPHLHQPSAEESASLEHRFLRCAPTSRPPSRLAAHAKYRALRASGVRHVRKPRCLQEARTWLRPHSTRKSAIAATTNVTTACKPTTRAGVPHRRPLRLVPPGITPHRSATLEAGRDAGRDDPGFAKRRGLYGASTRATGRSASRAPRCRLSLLQTQTCGFAPIRSRIPSSSSRLE